MKEFVKSDGGAVTVDWVVLTAAIVGLGLAAMGVVSGGVDDLSGDVEDELESNQIVRTNFNSAPTLVASFMSNADSSTPSCSSDGEGNTVCPPTIDTTYDRFWTDTGVQWTRVTTSVGGGDPVVTWENDDGEEVALHEHPDVPDDIPFSMDGNV